MGQLPTHSPPDQIGTEGSQLPPHETDVLHDDFVVIPSKSPVLLSCHKSAESENHEDTTATPNGPSDRREEREVEGLHVYEIDDFLCMSLRAAPTFSSHNLENRQSARVEPSYKAAENANERGAEAITEMLTSVSKEEKEGKSLDTLPLSGRGHSTHSVQTKSEEHEDLHSTVQSKSEGYFPGDATTSSGPSKPEKHSESKSGANTYQLEEETTIGGRQVPLLSATHSSPEGACGSDTMADNCLLSKEVKGKAASKVLQRKFDTLVKQVKPQVIAPPLFAKEIINKAAVEKAKNTTWGTEDRAQDLLLDLLPRVEARPEVFFTILKIFEDESVPCAEDLRADYYQELSRRATNSSVVSTKTLQLDTHEPDTPMHPVTSEQQIEPVPSVDDVPATPEAATPPKTAANWIADLENAYATGDTLAVQKIVDGYDSRSEDAGMVLMALLNMDPQLPGVLESFVDRGVLLESADMEGNTCLHFASRMSGLEALQTLLGHASPRFINSKNHHGDTALHAVCCSGEDSMISMLLKHNADVDIQNKEGFTPLHLAVVNGHETAVSMLLKHQPSTVDAVDIHYNKPIHLACKCNYPRITQMLVEYPGPINQQNSDGDAPIHLACRMNNLTLVQSLLECRSCTPYIVNNAGDTPLHIAVQNNNLDIVRALLDCCHKMAFINAQKQDLDTALHVACHWGYKSIVEALVKRKASKDVQNKDGLIPVEVARSHHHEKIVKFLERRKTWSFGS